MQTQPNILFIMCDDHAANAISAYRSRLSEVFQTPHIDRIANEGCRMDNCHCTNAICTPSRACILTGQYPHTTGVMTLSDHLDVNIKTYPQMLQSAGYQTALFGKWHVHSEPQGFDEYQILPNQGLYFDPVFVSKKDADWTQVHAKYEFGQYPDGQIRQGYVTDLITDYCIDWLDQRNRDQPFMLMCHHKAPHDYFEYHPRDEHLLDDITIPEPASLWEDKSHRSDGSRDFGTTISDHNLRRNYIKSMTDDDYPTGKLDVSGMSSKERTQAAYQKYLKDYLRTVKAIDDNVGRLLDYLDQQDLAENTLVVYTSDQGMFLGEHDYMDKRWIFDEALQMPLLVRFPKEIQPSTVVDTVVSNVDFAPTLLDYAGLDATDEMQGASIRQIIQGIEPDHWPNTAYNRYWMHMAHHDNPAHYGIRTKEYLLVYFYGLPLNANGAEQYITPEGWELYDIQKDPYQVNNVYNDPAYQSIVRDLKKQLKELKDTIGDEDTKYPEMMRLKQKLYCEDC